MIASKLKRNILFFLFMLVGMQAMANATYYAKVTASVNPTGAGTVYVDDNESPATKSTNTSGGEISFSIKAEQKEGYSFYQWTGDGSFNNANESNTTVTVNAATTADGTANYEISAKFRRLTTLEFDNVAPTISSDGWNIILPSVTLKAGNTEITGQTISYTVENCTLVNTNNGKATIKLSDTDGTTAVITATFAGNDTYAASTATYSVATNMHAQQNGTVVSVTGDVAITPQSATLDLGGTQKYSVPSSITAVTRNCEQYREFVCPNGSVYAYSSVGWKYTLTPPSATDNANATVNLLRIQWTFSDGATTYFTNTSTYSTTSSDITLTRNTTKTDVNKEYTITATVTYGTDQNPFQKVPTAKVIIPLTEVDLTAINVNPNSYTLNIGETADIAYSLSYDQGAKPYESISYTGYDSRIISVDANGRITAKAIGTTSVTIQSKKKDGTNGVSATVNVTVNVPSTNAGYVITYLNQHFLGGTSTADITTFNPSTCLWTGSDNGPWQNVGSKNYIYLEQSGNNNNRTQTLKIGATQQNFQLANNNKLYRNAASGRNNANWYVRWSGSAWQASTTNDNNGNVLYPVTKYTYPEAKTDPEFTGDDSFASTGYKNYSIITDASYKPEYYDYVFYNNNHHYCLTETSNATTKAPDDEEITYSWSVSDTSGKVAVDAASGRVTYNSYFEDADGQDVTLTLTATSASGVVMTASKVIHFDPTRDDPTSITAENTTVYVGKSATLTINMQPAPCYRKLECTSSNTSVVTVDNKGNVTGVAVGTATITIQAVLYNGSKPASLKTTATVTVRDQVATPEIQFTPVVNSTDATVKIDCATSGSTIYYTTDGNDPTTASIPYNGEFTVENLTEVKAIAVMPNTVANYSLWDDSETASATYSAQKLPTPEIKIRGNEVTFDCDEPGVTYRYTTNGNDPTASTGTVWDGNAITNIATGSTIKVIATKTGFAPSEVATETLRQANVVYLDFTNGNDNNDGTAANKAKKTWAGAYAKLGFGPNAKYLRSQWSSHGLTGLSGHSAFNGLTDADFTSTVDNNIIYLVGDVEDTNAQFRGLMQKTTAHPESESDLMNTVISSGFFKPVTISGKYATSHITSDGVRYARINVSGDQNYTLNEDMRFENIEFYGNNSSSVNFLLAYYDLEMGNNIITSNFYPTSSFSEWHHGYKQGYTRTAHILFYGGYSNDARFGNGTNAELGYDYCLPHPDGYKITIRSGYFSTISPGGTQWNQYSNINGCMGSPNMPVKCTITVDIDRAWNDAHNKIFNDKTVEPNCDIAVVLAGTHEGTMYGDVDIIVKSGKIDRVVNGTFGANYFVGSYPADSYFGRANTLIDPREPSSSERAAGYTTKNKMVEIRELYGGGLGRFKSNSSTTNQSSTYFYGQSSVVINGGTFETALYASGAGGVNGVGDDNHNTPDQLIPYWNGSNIAYGTYSAHKDAINKFYVVCRNSSQENDTTHVYISKTSAKIEIHGGVFGTADNPASIYGGGYGYVDSELINASSNGAKPNTRAGAIFAAAGQTGSSVTIDGDAVVYGNVFGAGRGASQYRTANITYNGDNYTQLGQVYGNTALTIGGNAIINGSVFGAGEGITGSDYTNMARHFGNTTVTIGEDAQITGGVYGGGMNGSIGCTSGHTNEGGNVSVTITGNAKIGTSAAPANVHGGGLGSSTRVLGNVEVNIGTNTSGTLDGNAVIYGDVYGGSAEGKTNGNTARTNNSTTTVTLNSGTINGSLYGGGLGSASNAADVYGPVQVNVYGGKVTTTSVDGSGAVYGCNNVNGSPQSTVNVDIYGTDPAPSVDDYALDAVYGGGNRAAYTGTPVVAVHNCENSIDYVYGGGNQANVKGTNVTVEGGNVIGSVFGGGNNANVTTDGTKVFIKGGRILDVYGGNNNGGTITGAVKVNVNQSGDSCPVNVDNLYGGGNKAAYSGSPTVDLIKGSVGNVYGGGMGNTAIVGGNPTVNISGGTATNVFGGGSQANTDGKTTINITGGTVTDAVYGGGALANTGNTEVNLTGGTVNDVYGGGLGSATVAAEVGSTTVNIGTGTFDGDNNLTSATGDCTINGQVFGCNNLNGTPKGNATVNVYKTHTDTPADPLKPYNSKIAAVYGGGNLAAYLPTDMSTSSTATTKVEVFTCWNVIDYVYGGGNAASTPATNVTIHGGKMVNVFGGGNGKTEEGAATENPGADVGYRDFTWDADHEYGAGTTTVHIWGGVINSVFGGSNTKGNIRVSSTVDLDEHDACEFEVGDVYGAGNMAVMYGSGNVKIGCIPGMKEIYGGAKQADINGDVSLTITNGTFGRVFGGNNIGGTISGTITVNIEETGCNPVVIGEVYGGGNKAAYTGNPTVNAYSFTKIGTIFGGGYGIEATVTGNTSVNVQQLPGKHADKIGGEIGTIGGIFGGGNEAMVDGNTNISIGTEETVTFTSLETDKIKNVTGANILPVTVTIPADITGGAEETYTGNGNVYGGGNHAAVTGKTSVTVGR